MLASSPQTCHLQNCEKRSFCSLSHPLYIFCYNSLSRLRQPLSYSPCPSHFSLPFVSQAHHQLSPTPEFSSSSSLDPHSHVTSSQYSLLWQPYLKETSPVTLHLSTQLTVFAALLLSAAICSFIYLPTYLLVYLCHTFLLIPNSHTVKDPYICYFSMPGSFRGSIYIFE